MSNYCKLTDVAEMHGRVGWKGYTVEDLVDEGPLVIGANDITSDNQLVLNNVKHLTREKYEESPEIFLKKDDLLVVKVGSTIGKVCIINKEIGEASINPNCVIVRAKNINPYYLYCYMCSPTGKAYLINNSSASGQPALNQKDLGNMPIPIVDKSKQEIIAKVFSNLNKKIEINILVNSELESMAKAIYDYWFLQFEFPNKEGKPYKSSGGKMVWNDELKREIPEGWEVKSISEIASLYQPKTISGDEILQNGKYLVYGANGIVGTYNEYNHKNNEIAICCRGASCGDYLMTLPKSWITGNAMVVNISDAKLKEFVFYGLSKEGIAPFISGSAQPQITRANLENMKLIMPTYELIDKFGKISVSYRKQIENNAFQCQQLTSLRDFLLPMLMNGQVTFKDENY